MKMHLLPRISVLYYLSICLNVEGFFPSPPTSSRARQGRFLLSAKPEEAALERTVSQLERLRLQAPRNRDESVDPDVESAIVEYLRQPANTLKQDLRARNLPTKGRKPDLARRLAEHELQLKTGRVSPADADGAVAEWNPASESTSSSEPLTSFCGLRLSRAASVALGNANFKNPSPIQRAAIPRQLNGESIIVHAQTGSGKTLAYLLPITEQLWREHDSQTDEGYGMILTPTRELAAQVAGIASVLAPPGTVRMVTHPCNLMSDGVKERGELENGGRLGDSGRSTPRLFIGSARSIMGSLYGNRKMPAPPTTKPEAKYLLMNTRWVVLDEVDRLLDVNGGRGASSSKKKHEKPAAVVTSAVARLTLGRAQVVSASATVGRSLKRELSRILGLSPKEWPPVVRGDDAMQEEEFRTAKSSGHLGRAVTIPETVENYVVAVDTSSVGKLLTSAFYVLRSLNKKKSRRILLVLTKGSGINTQNTIGALKHFRCQPEPQSLLDVLEADGSDRLIAVHRQVTGATGVGEAIADEKDEGYLLVTGEDTVRGLHLDGLDVVVVVGRAHGPDEYTHIAGRTGRAGRTGKVINVVSEQHAAAVKAWEKMLDSEFRQITIEDVELLD